MKRFTYQLEIEGIEYNQNTVKSLFGKEAGYNSDFPEDTVVAENIYNVFSDAIANVLKLQSKFLGKTNVKDISELSPIDRRFYDYLENKIEIYHKLEKSLKLIKSENI